MARTSEGESLTRRHRQAQLALRAGALRDVQRLWSLVSASDLAGSFSEFAELAYPLIVARHRESAGLASTYYRLLRAVEGSVAGEPPVVLAERPGRDEVIGNLHVTGLSGIFVAVKSGFSPQAALQNGLVRTMGSAGRMVLKGGRDTISATTGADRRAVGWRRVTSGGSCEWCNNLAAEGIHSAGGGFEAHDHCACAAEPDFT